MKKREYVSYGLLSFILGLFIVPAVLEWLSVSFSFADVLYMILGEPNPMNIALVVILTGVFLCWVGYRFYKGYKSLD